MKSINIHYTRKTSKLLERFLFVFWFCDTNNSTRVLSLQENNKYTQKQFSPTALSYSMLQFVHPLHEGWSKRNAPILLCWPMTYSSRGWTIVSILHFILSPHNRWQHRDSLTKWHLRRTCIWSKAASLNSSMRKKWHSLAFINTLLNVDRDQTVDASTVRGQWCVSAEARVIKWSPPLVQMFTSVVCRLLLIAGKNAQPMVMTVLKNRLL